ncbi:MAG TPA: type II secretion system inner membrane protein GspF [bacterium]|nr:type II secretion system inner membrane protein GspF [bacterium]
MALYAYRIMDRDGHERKGAIEGSSRNAVKAKFQADGWFVVDIREKASREGLSLFRTIFSMRRKKVAIEEVASMTRLLATLQKARIPLVESIAAVAQQQDNPRLGEVLMLVKTKMQEGYSFSRAARDFPEVFSPLYCNMIAAGEESGATEAVLLRLADFLESQMDLRNKVRSAMTYPIILFVVAIMVVALLFTVVIPKISKMFEDVNMLLPLQTRILIWISGTVSSYWWLMLLTAVAGYVGFLRWKKTPSGEEKWNRLLITAPIFGRINRMVAISRFAKTLSTLLTSGVPILAALDIVRKVIENRVIENAVAAARENIKEGESIAVPLKRSGEFPPIVIQMIAIGEKSGELEEMLETLAGSYEKEVRYSLERLTATINPIMIVFLALVIGFIIFAVVMPILKINEAVG